MSRQTDHKADSTMLLTLQERRIRQAELHLGKVRRRKDHTQARLKAARAALNRNNTRMETIHIELVDMVATGHLQHIAQAEAALAATAASREESLAQVEKCTEQMTEASQSVREAIRHLEYLQARQDMIRDGLRRTQRIMAMRKDNQQTDNFTEAVFIGGGAG